MVVKDNFTWWFLHRRSNLFSGVCASCQTAFVCLFLIACCCNSVALLSSSNQLSFVCQPKASFLLVLYYRMKQKQAWIKQCMNKWWKILWILKWNKKWEPLYNCAVAGICYGELHEHCKMITSWLNSCRSLNKNQLPRLWGGGWSRL